MLIFFSVSSSEDLKDMYYKDKDMYYKDNLKDKDMPTVDALEQVQPRYFNFSIDIADTSNVKFLQVLLSGFIVSVKYWNTVCENHKYNVSVNPC